MTSCPTHKDDWEQCQGCLEWRQQRAKEAEEFSYFLERTHIARSKDVLGIVAFSQVPAVREREEDPALMIWAYALLVHRLITR